MTRRLIGVVLVAGLVACAGPEQAGRGVEMAGGPDPEPAVATPDPAATPDPVATPRHEPGAAVAPSCDDLREEPPVDGSLSDDDDVAAAQRARAFLGLPSDEGTVRDLLAGNDERDWTYPFPHTDAELAELSARNAGAPDTGEVHDWIAAEAAADYAGMWLDHRAGPALVVAFAARVEEHAQALHERWGDRVLAVAADHTYAELEAVQRQVVDEMAAGSARQAERRQVYPDPGTLLGSGIDDKLNRVTVDVAGGDVDALVAVGERYGADLICLVIHEAPEPLDYGGPLRPLAKAEGWRQGLHERTDVFALVEIAYDRDTAERAWADNVPAGLPEEDGDPAWPGLYGTLDGVDFATEAVIVWSSGQSSSCPGWLAGVDTSGGEVAVRVGSAGLGGCTADYQPYRMVAAVDRSHLPEPADLPILDGDRLTVAAYPLDR